MMRALAWLTLAGLLLSGCATKTPTATTAADTTTRIANPSTVHGVVVDGAIRPLAGALVSLRDGEATRATNTSADGRFQFASVTLGAHALKVQLKGFQDAQITFEVDSAVATAEQRIILAPDASFKKPYVQQYKFQGLIECGGVVDIPPPAPGGYAALAACDLPNEVTGQKLTDDKFMTLESVDGGAPAWVQCEVVWESTSPLGNSFLVYMDELNRTGAGSGGKGSATSAKFTELTNAHGTSPLVAHLSGKEVDRLGRGFDLQVRVFPWYEDPKPIGVTYEQAFTVYTDIFYGFTPPDGWTLGKDGAVPVPA